MNLYQHATKSGFLIILFYGYSWFKNPAIWLAESILAHISGTRFFQNMGFVQQCKKFSNKFKKLYFWPIFPIFGSKIFFSKNLAVTHNTTWASNTMLSSRKKTNEPNPKKTAGQKDGQTLIHRTLLVMAGSPKSPNLSRWSASLIIYKILNDFTNHRKKTNKAVVFSHRPLPNIIKYRDHRWQLSTI